MGLLNMPLYYYRQRPGSLTSVDPLTTLTRMSEQNAIALTAAVEGGFLRLADALTRRGQLIQDSLAYRKFLRDLRNRDMAKVGSLLRERPQLGVILINRLTGAARRRVLR
jgi:hypothetical protein